MGRAGALVREGAGAVRAGVGALARVAALVPQHVGALHEAHGAVRARVPRARVDLHVLAVRVLLLYFNQRNELK